MRLLNANTIQLEHFLGDVPRYAILSHTWQVEEMQFSDMTKPVEQRKASVGYQKILKCCAQASFDDCAYVWIDTCCINSDSSSELSEAINSMYDWYNKAAFCYVYLADVDLDGQNRLAFEKSRWFTRGWTLQELLAPKQVIFFDCMWRRLGTKESEQWHPKILRATGIEACHLDQPLDASIAQKMSWVSKRRTTRKEDIVYCMLGLFNVNMPLLYGEGERAAFRRLQLEIIAVSNDETIFAWTNDDCHATGLLAASPADFADSHDISTLGPDLTRRRSQHTIRAPYVMTNIGLDIGRDVRLLKFEPYVDFDPAFRSDIDHVYFKAKLACKKRGKVTLALHMMMITHRGNQGKSKWFRSKVESMSTAMRVWPGDLTGWTNEISITGELFKSPTRQRLFVPDFQSAKPRNLQAFPIYYNPMSSKGVPMDGQQKLFEFQIGPRIESESCHLGEPPDSPHWKLLHGDVFRKGPFASKGSTFWDFVESSGRVWRVKNTVESSRDLRRGLRFTDSKHFSLMVDWSATNPRSPGETPLWPCLRFKRFKSWSDLVTIPLQPALLGTGSLRRESMGVIILSPVQILTIHVRKGDSQPDVWVAEIDIADITGHGRLTA